MLDLKLRSYIIMLVKVVKWSTETTFVTKICIKKNGVGQ